MAASEVGGGGVAGLVAQGAGSVALRRSPDFRRYWSARMVSVTGTLVTYLVMPVLVYQLTGSNLWTALAVVAEGLPYLLVGLFAGVVADRTDRRRLMVAADLANAAVLASVPIAYAAGALTAVHAIAAALLVQALFVFFDAANFGALPALVGRDRIAAATSAVYGGSTVLELTVPMAAGALLVLLAPPVLLTVDVLSFVCSALLIRAITTPLQGVLDRTGRTSVRADIREGLSFLWRQPVVRVQTVVGSLQSAAGGAFMGQFVPWLDQVLHVEAGGDLRYGALFTAWGLGGLVASATLPRLVRAIGEPRITLLFLPLSALTGLLCALATHWLAAAAMLVAWGVAYSLVVLTAIAFRQKVTPDRLQSRVNIAGRMLSFGLGYPLGALAGGVVSELSGPRTAIITSIALIGAAAVVAWLSPLRTMPPG